jgi:antitoxin component YwqK of YwqJK toxin-antitoxin module
MKCYNINSFWISLLLIFFLQGGSLFSQQFRMFQGDTINRVDVNNMRQGSWKIFGDMTDDGRFKPTDITEEGRYLNNKKDGVWTSYYPSGKQHTIITYVSNKPNGTYKVFYENGQLEEEGTWKMNKNTGNFKRFYTNGKPHQEFVFNTNGRRNGTQKYYYENGQLMIVGEVAEGKETGEFKEYYEDGSLKSVKFYDEPGLVKHEKTKEYEAKTKMKPEPVMEVIDAQKTAVVEKGSVQNEAEKQVNPFDGNGEHTLYNSSRQISQKGYFKNYKLVDGYYYRYNDDGILKNIERYKGGKYVGDAPLEEAEGKK